MRDLEKREIYKGFEVYSGSKADKGLIYPMIDWLIEAIEIVKEEHQRPIALHIILSEPNFEKMRELGSYLKRFATRRKRDKQHSETIYYIVGHEIRPRNKERHSHLWIFCDNFLTLERALLKEELVKLGFAKKAKVAKRNRRLFPKDWQGNEYFHSVRVEAHDLILRASYITKHATKTTDKRRRWSASVLPKAPVSPEPSPLLEAA